MTDPSPSRCNSAPSSEPELPTPRFCFGQTKTSAQKGNRPSQRVETGSVGRPSPGFNMSLPDVDGKSAKEGDRVSAFGRESGLIRRAQLRGRKVAERPDTKARGRSEVLGANFAPVDGAQTGAAAMSRK